MKHLDVEDVDSCRAHLTRDTRFSLMLYRLKMHCQHANVITAPLTMVSLSAGDASKINGVQSINPMDEMSEGLWMWVRKAFLWVNMFMSPTVCLGAQRRQWVRLVPTKAPCVQSRTRSTESAGWWVGTMLLSLTRRKEKEKRKAGEENPCLRFRDN